MWFVNMFGENDNLGVVVALPAIMKAALNRNWTLPQVVCMIWERSCALIGIKPLYQYEFIVIQIHKVRTYNGN